jgi:glycosyltransferase involved in cell wall biosynthesis
MEVRLVPGGRGTWWEQVRLPRALAREDFDVLFAPAYTAPAATRVPVVVTVHDVSFLAHPEWFAPRTRLRRKLVTASSVRRARRVIAVAEFTRREIVERLGVSREKVLVIPHGLSQVRAAASPAAPDRRPGDEAQLVLFVGSVFNRRHVPELIEAFARVAASRPGIRLEIVGDNRTYPPQDLDDLAARRGVGPLTTVRSYVTDDDLADLYQAASVFVFLSDYEGFGFTPLEALAAGVPILVGDTPVAREVYGEAAAFVPTTDVAAIAAKLDRLLGDAEARRALLSQAPGVLGRYSWDRAGRQTLAALEEAARA